LIIHRKENINLLRNIIIDYFSEFADRLLSGNGKFEEIIACSQEIAAATAQLVAASNVN
jgi:hypothetical protein